MIASGSDDKSIKIWDYSTNQTLYTLEGHQAYVRCIIVLQDASLLASASFDTTVRIWNYRKQKCEKSLQGHTKPILTICKIDDDQIASGGEDYLIKIWNWKDASLLKQLNMNKNEIWVLITVGQFLFSGHKDGTIKVLKYRESAIFKELRGHKSYVNCILDLKMKGMIGSCSSDLTINIWNFYLGSLIRTLKGHVDIVWDLASL